MIGANAASLQPLQCCYCTSALCRIVRTLKLGAPYSNDVLFAFINEQPQSKDEQDAGSNVSAVAAAAAAAGNDYSCDVTTQLSSGDIIQ